MPSDNHRDRPGMTLYAELLSRGADENRRLVRVERDQARAVLTLCDPRWIRREFGGFVRTVTSTDKIFIAAVNGAAARAAADAAWEQSLKLEEYAEANCFSTTGLPAAAAAIKTG